MTAMSQKPSLKPTQIADWLGQWDGIECSTSLVAKRLRRAKCYLQDKLS